MLLILLLAVPLLAGLGCLLARSQRVLEALNLLPFAMVATLAVFLGAHVLRHGSVEALNGFLYADSLSALVIGLTGFVALACSVYAIGYFRHELRSGKITPTQFRRYYSLTPLFVFAMLLVTLANSLGVMWVAIEGTTLASVLLIAFYNERTSLEAAWKYIIIGSVGISLALLGTIFTYYSASGVLGPDSPKGLNWSVLLPLADKFNVPAMKLAFVLALLGYGTKLGLAPMHTWKPDAYSEAPVPAAALLAAGVINCAFYAVIRFQVLAAKCLGFAFPSKLLLLFGLASMIVAAPFILVQRNYRRLIAYSSIEHAGIMVTALGFGGKLGVLGALLHMLFHAVTKPLIFFCAGNVQQHFATPYLRKVSGVIHVLPATGILLLVATLAMTGTPPFSIFQSEFMILSAGMAGGRDWLVAVFMICVVTIFAGFLSHIVRMSLGATPPNTLRASGCRWKLTAMAMVLAPLVVLGLWLPGSLFELVQAAARIIGGTP
jgi:hydrogenase-4 component F